MTPITIRMFQGDTDSWVFTDIRDGAPYNLTGATISFTAKRKNNEGSNVFQKTVGSGIVITTPASGIFTVTLSAGDTSSLAKRTHILDYDIVVTKSGVVKTIQAGDLVVYPRLG